MNAAETDNAGEQAKLWNGGAGAAWVEEQSLLEGLFKPFEALLADAVVAGGHRSVLDVGCGTGATTLAVARRLRDGGRCVGVDISEPMLAAARTRAAREDVPATFLHGDAQDHPFEPGQFDALISRFGVMFFTDPVAAFGNLRRAAAGGAALRCIAWRGPEDNPFMTAAERAAAHLLPALPARRPDAPGQFGFAGRERVRTILAESGWTKIDIQPLDVTCTMPVSQLPRYLSRLGPVGRVLEEMDDERAREQILANVRPAFDEYVHGSDVRFTASCWMIAAHA